MSSSPPPDYAGDLTVREAWDLLAGDTEAQLIDVRTVAEWTFVGLPDLSGLARPVHRIEWQSYPSMQPNPHFVADAIQALGEADKDAPVMFLCRTGARSRAAAMAMTRAGYRKAFNIEGGFEGAMDQHGHRGTIEGWKAAGLPWRQS